MIFVERSSRHERDDVPDRPGGPGQRRRGLFRCCARSASCCASATGWRWWSSGRRTRRGGVEPRRTRRRGAAGRQERQAQRRDPAACRATGDERRRVGAGGRCRPAGRSDADKSARWAAGPRHRTGRDRARHARRAGEQGAAGAGLFRAGGGERPRGGTPGAAAGLRFSAHVSAARCRRSIWPGATWPAAGSGGSRVCSTAHRRAS